ncbi:MAG TPA: histidine kinase, partial [Comamonadaceae bacterium]|nr:histidine kinase [Comamonadaceae bacterium]
ANPFIFLYLLQVTLGAALLRSRHVWTLVAVTTLCVALLTRFHLPLPLTIDFSRGLASPYVLGLLACFVLNAALVAVFMSRIGRNLRQRDARLAA